MVRSVYFIIFFLLLLRAQSQIQLHFFASQNPTETLAAGKGHFELAVCKFYIGKITLLHQGAAVWSEGENYHLIQLKEASGDTITLNTPTNIEWDSLRITFGVDSATNTGGAKGGELDPMQGMYWTWQSGYIFTKVEGVYFDNTGEQEVQWHLGGYAFPENALQERSYSTADSVVHFCLNWNVFLQQALASDQKSIMSPCARAVDLQAHFVNSFILVEQ